MAILNLDDCRPSLKGSVAVSRKVAMPNFGSLGLEFSQEFYLDKSTHEQVADDLAEKVRQKLSEWGAVK